MLVGELALPAATWSLQNPKVLTIEKSSPVTIFSKTFTFFSLALWERSRARARDQQYQHKVNCTYMYCVYACCWGVGNPDKSFIIFFQHEINHAPLMFLGTDFWSTVPLHHTDFRPLSTPKLIRTLFPSDLWCLTMTKAHFCVDMIWEFRRKPTLRAIIRYQGLH